jgi:hypothetical protein
MPIPRNSQRSFEFSRQNEKEDNARRVPWVEHRTTKTYYLIILKLIILKWVTSSRGPYGQKVEFSASAIMI